MSAFWTSRPTIPAPASGCLHPTEKAHLPQRLAQGPGDRRPVCPCTRARASQELVGRLPHRFTHLGAQIAQVEFSLDFLHRHEHVIMAGPVGVGKPFLAQALGYAVRTGHSVRFTRADAFFRTLSMAGHARKADPALFPHPASGVAEPLQASPTR